MTNHVTRYIAIWDQIRQTPIAERSPELQRELDYLWYNKMTDEDKAQVDTFLEVRN